MLPPLERGWWRDSRVNHDGRTESKGATNDTWQRDGRAKGDEKGSWRHDGFFEMEADLPPTRKRPAFREKKIEVDSETDKVATETLKSSHPDRPLEGSGKKEERGHGGRRLDRPEKPFLGDNPPNRREAERAGFLSRERYGGGNGNYKGRDRFGERQGYRGSGTRVEKWTHDLYQEANRSPTPKNEEDQIAKVEALLAS